MLLVFNKKYFEDIYEADMTDMKVIFAPET